FGYGRFGRALGERLLEGGCSLRTYDPGNPPAGDLACEDAADLCSSADTIFLAVPVANTAEALRELRPQLSADQLVVDLGSVKVRPCEWMQRILGEDIPWLGAHPLFGPTSLALGERPLRVVLCPNQQHPTALERTARIFRSIGCEIVEKDAETHDREMAEGHALAYFVAKGFLDAGVDLEAPFAPPSVHAIARTVASVQADAAHLFASLHRENPFAAEARARLLQAMQATDAALSAPSPEDEVAHRESGVLHMEHRAETPPALDAARQVIDEIDRDLLGLLARRADVALRAAKAKAEAGREIRDPEREAKLLDQRRGIASDMGLEPSAVEDIFQAILSFSRRHQKGSRE
ncbi:MAG: prephenate dehydrogenase/arogenate dehydrogenase family protein, partial [Planctomycetota bacterium]